MSAILQICVLDRERQGWKKFRAKKKTKKKQKKKPRIGNCAHCECEMAALSLKLDLSSLPKEDEEEQRVLMQSAGRANSQTELISLIRRTMAARYLGSPGRSSLARGVLLPGKQLAPNPYPDCIDVDGRFELRPSPSVGDLSSAQASSSSSSSSSS
jgi:hypothetical protein